MENNKKSLRINTAVCDVRNITEELLSAYDEVRINTAAIITSREAQVLLGKYNVRINAAGSALLEGDIRCSVSNGSAKISPTQTLPEEGVYRVINGSLMIEPGCEEVVKRYAGIYVNGSVTCPEGVAALLSSATINGSIRTYPDGAILLKNTAVLDRVFHLRAKQDALYYAANRIIALSPGINFAKLAEKNVRFAAKTLLVTESQAEAAVPLIDDRTDIEILPDGCAYVGGDAELNAGLLKRYGGKLYVNGDLTVGPDSADILEQVSFLKINGDLLVCRSLRDQVLAMGLEYDDLCVVGGVLINGRPNVEVSAAMLENAADGVSLVSCSSVTVAEDITPELLREKLVSVAACSVVQCSEAQRPVIEEIAQDVACISCGEEEEEESFEDENTTHINAAFYTL